MRALKRLREIKLVNLIDTVGELLVVYATALVFGALLFSFFEGKGFFESLWWAGVTATTVGYGDMYPTTVGGRITAFVLMHFTLLLVLPLLIGNICKTLVRDENAFTDQEQEEIKSKLNLILQQLEQHPKELDWETAVEISDKASVHNALMSFSHDSTQDNAVGLIRTISRHTGELK